MTARSVTLVVNPTAGGGRAERLRTPVLDALRSTGWDVTEVVPGSAAEATALAAAAGPDDLFATLGGDGLLGAVASGAMESGALVAPLPGGRGNDFARAVGITDGILTVAKGLPTATERRVDIGEVAGTRFLGVAAVGYDSVANRIANESRLRGPLVYTVGGVKAVFRTRPRRFVLTVDGRREEVEAWNVAVGNSGRYGGGIHICPDAVLDDGQLDLVVTGRTSRVAFAVTELQTFSGKHVHRPGVRSSRARTVRIEGPSDLDVYADGDPIGRLPVTVTVHREAVRILAG
ncbi:diacylglycerol/lipid kinase family protein [Janibacter massiliensis]|uniref:diacylglycerol/lipid kinase family protein n=1 Tax=Janibacter massiliensis TaxID=2058291 RepID=UPI000D0EBB79|nr:diacylglycerol kinase family protein [Janibacter massiliensis]